MTGYDSMTPFEIFPEHEKKVPERTLLHIPTPEATPNKAHDLGFDWNQGTGPGWHHQPWPSVDTNNSCSKHIPNYADETALRCSQASLPRIYPQYRTI